MSAERQSGNTNLCRMFRGTFSPRRVPAKTTSAQEALDARIVFLNAPGNAWEHDRKMRLRTCSWLG